MKRNMNAHAHTPRERERERENEREGRGVGSGDTAQKHQVNCDNVLGTNLRAAGNNINRNSACYEYFEYLPYH